MHNLKRWAFCLLLLGCNQERNKSIEAMNQGVEAGRQKLFERAISQLQQAISLDASTAAFVASREATNASRAGAYAW